MTDWQPIETAPKDGRALLLWCPGVSAATKCGDLPDIMIGLWSNGATMRLGWYGEVGDIETYEFDTSFDRTQLDPTHWMPLPEPPE